DPTFTTWPDNLFLTFPIPTAQELDNLKAFFTLVNNAGLSYEVVLLMADSQGLYYQNGVTGRDYNQFVDAIWPAIWTGKMEHLYVGGDLVLDATKIDYINPDSVPTGVNFISNHRRWVNEMWPYVVAKCLNCNLGVELRTAYASFSDLGAASAMWVRANL